MEHNFYDSLGFRFIRLVMIYTTYFLALQFLNWSTLPTSTRYLLLLLPYAALYTWKQRKNRYYR